MIKQKALEYNEIKYRTITELSLSMVYDLDIRTGENYWGGAIQEITGYTPNEYQKFGYEEWSNAIHPDDRVVTLQSFEDAHLNHQKFNAEYRYKTKYRCIYLYRR